MEIRARSLKNIEYPKIKIATGEVIECLDRVIRSQLKQYQPLCFSVHTSVPRWLTCTPLIYPRPNQ
jgi:hypothetical protein